MKKTHKAKLHTTDFLDEFLAGISENEQKETTARMKLAAAIDDAMKAQNISKSELATLTGQNNSVITKWLSGTQNFTTDTLEDIGQALHIDLLLDYKAAPVVLEKKVLKKSQIPKKRNYFAEHFSKFTFGTRYTAPCI